jgi:hypothetical protein
MFCYDSIKHPNYWSSLFDFSVYIYRQTDGQIDKQGIIVIVKKFYLEILMDLHILSLPEYEKLVFGMSSVCMH